MSGIFALYPSQLYGLYERWKLDNNREWGAAALVQNIIMAHFRIEDNWCPTFEQPPDDGDRKKYRIDVFLLEFGHSYIGAPGLLCPRLLIEIKGGGGSPRDVEEQALANARATIQQYGIHGLYVQTIIGIELNLYFRFWWLGQGDRSLTRVGISHPLEDLPGRRKGYIRLDAENGDVLDWCYDQVKRGGPPHAVTEPAREPEQPLAEGAPQPIPPGQHDYAQAEQYQGHEANPVNEGYNVERDAFSRAQLHPEQQFDGEQGQRLRTYGANLRNEDHDANMTGMQEGQSNDTNPDSENDMELNSAEAGTHEPRGGSAATPQRQRTEKKQVKISKETHFWAGQPTEYIFKRHGKPVTTFEEDWDKKKIGHEERWTWKKDTKYWGWKP